MPSQHWGAKNLESGSHKASSYTQHPGRWIPSPTPMPTSGEEEGPSERGGEGRETSLLGGGSCLNKGSVVVESGTRGQERRGRKKGWEEEAGQKQRPEEKRVQYSPAHLGCPHSQVGFQRKSPRGRKAPADTVSLPQQHPPRSLPTPL